jgi:hypothetical protein
MRATYPAMTLLFIVPILVYVPSKQVHRESTETAKCGKKEIKDSRDLKEKFHVLDSILFSFNIPANWYEKF